MWGRLPVHNRFEVRLEEITTKPCYVQKKREYESAYGTLDRMNWEEKSCGEMHRRDVDGIQ